MDYIWLILLLAIGVVAIIWPEKLWKLEHLFTVKGGEPTEFYLGVSRVLGVIFTFTAIICGIIFIVD